MFFKGRSQPTLTLNSLYLPWDATQCLALFFVVVCLGFGFKRQCLGDREEAQCLRALDALLKDQVLFPAPTGSSQLSVASAAENLMRTHSTQTFIQATYPYP